jgi:ribosomal protein S18 acetylase RimI-like enzyme
MGVTLEHRGRGVGRALLDAALDAARAAGARVLLLEVIGQNTSAVALYESGGFTRTRRLVGRARPPVEASPAPEHRMTDVEELARALMAEPDLPWPWQMEPASVTSLSGFEVHALGPDAFACVRPSPQKLTLRHLVVRPPARRRGLARRLLASIQARHPEAAWDIPPLVPEGLAAPALDALGFGPMEHFQLEMERPLP